MIDNLRDLIVPLEEPHSDWLDIATADKGAVRVNPHANHIRLMITHHNTPGQSWSRPFEEVILTRDQAKALMLAIASTLQVTE